ncbi:hypothetical protein D3C72_2098390 [compost metagenome]
MRDAKADKTEGRRGIDKGRSRGEPADRGDLPKPREPDYGKQDAKQSESTGKADQAEEVRCRQWAEPVRSQGQGEDRKGYAGKPARPMGGIGIGALVPDHHVTESIPCIETDPHS